MTAIIDYDAGNIKSVENALRSLGEDVLVTRDADRIAEASRVILPGVGAFGNAMEKLRAYQLEQVITDTVNKGTPFLGICLGLQLFFEESEESPGVRGLSLLSGKIRKIPEGEGLKIPHIGWNDLTFPKKTRLFEGTDEHSFVYFVHSYYLNPDESLFTAACTFYGVSIGAAVEKENLFACQFHPEKSADTGMRILKNFLSIK